MKHGNLIGIGLYTPAEAGRLLHVPAARITRWLRGSTGSAPLWTSQVELDDGLVYLGFRDLMEARIADKFIRAGISAQRVRAAIRLASEVIGDARPLSTDRFRTDGRSIFLKTAEGDAPALLNLFSRQYAFEKIIEPLLKNVEFEGGQAPAAWWPLGRQKQILVDPRRAFGQPIDAVSSVPTAILAAAARQEGIARAAMAFMVPPASVKRAMEFENGMELKAAA
jgi:hypothetical protein